MAREVIRDETAQPGQPVGRLERIDGDLPARLAHLAPAVKANPGLRVPGAFNGFEMGLRAILGQQVTVKAATTIAARFVQAFGESVTTPLPELGSPAPSPTRSWWAGCRSASRRS